MMLSLTNSTDPINSTMFNNIYKNKTVLITGHTGFKGSWLAIWLKELVADVVGIM